MIAGCAQTSTEPFSPKPAVSVRDSADASVGRRERFGRGVGVCCTCPQKPNPDSVDTGTFFFFLSIQVCRDKQIEMFEKKQTARLHAKHANSPGQTAVCRANEASYPRGQRTDERMYSTMRYASSLTKHRRSYCMMFYVK